jgi:glycosyltransferase involved in cell wall biosynthesis
MAPVTRALAGFSAMGGEPGSTAEPRLSIVVPVYLVERYLAACVESILAETDGPIEVIAIDDGSPDRCGAILDEYARRDQRLVVLHQPTNGGLAHARNTGLDRATGEYVWFVDSDDWLPPGSVDAVRERLAATRPDVLVIEHAEVFTNGRVLGRALPETTRDGQPPTGLADRPELLRLAQSACTKVVRRRLLIEVGLRFQSGWYEDVSYSHQLLMAAPRIDVLHRNCYSYRRQVAGGITSTTSPRHFEVFDQYERLFGLVDESGGRYEPYRAELFCLMVNHCLVIVGSDSRLPARSRRAFFDRLGIAYRRWLPESGYPVPGGVTGLKHWLVRHRAYRTYAALRLAYRAAGRLPLGRLPRWRLGGLPPGRPARSSRTGEVGTDGAPDNKTVSAQPGPGPVGQNGA